MPRKTCEAVGIECRRREASMRPRPDAAENHSLELPDAAAHVASMRPRPDAAENLVGACCVVRVEQLQ